MAQEGSIDETIVEVEHLVGLSLYRDSLMILGLAGMVFLIRYNRLI